ncbi:MAG: hypothetical protein ACR2RF_09380 [Geminicoccaceae bacterium]
MAFLDSFTSSVRMMVTLVDDMIGIGRLGRQTAIGAAGVVRAVMWLRFPLAVAPMIDELIEAVHVGLTRAGGRP